MITVATDLSICNMVSQHQGSPNSDSGQPAMNDIVDTGSAAWRLLRARTRAGSR